VEFLKGLSCLVSLSMTWRKRQDAVLSGLWTDECSRHAWDRACHLEGFTLAGGLGQQEPREIQRGPLSQLD